jgi:hypothetical protein
LETDPQRRYQHASEVKTDMDAISRGAAAPAESGWRYDLGALALGLGTLGVTAAGLGASKSGYSLVVLLVPWLFLYMAVSRGAKLTIEIFALAGAIALVGWGVWLEQSSWALLGLVPAAFGFGCCRHAYGRGWDDRFAERYFLPAVAFLGVLGVIFMGMAIAESAWPLTIILAVLAACMAGVFGTWAVVDEEGWKQFTASDAGEEQPEVDASEAQGDETAAEDDDWLGLPRPDWNHDFDQLGILWVHRRRLRRSASVPYRRAADRSSAAPASRAGGVCGCGGSALPLCLGRVASGLG